jgi:hypothetical protein
VGIALFLVDMSLGGLGKAQKAEVWDDRARNAGGGESAMCGRLAAGLLRKSSGLR